MSSVGGLRHRTSAIVLALALVVGAASLAAEQAPEALLAAADAPRQTLREGSMRIRATVEEAGKPPSVNELDVYLKWPDRALCVFRTGNQKDRRILVVKERSWLLVPGTTHAIPVSANQRLLGAASIADVARLRFADEFDGTPRGEESVDGVLCRVIDLKARSRASSYHSGTLWVRAGDGRAEQARLALRSGKDAKQIRFSAYGEEDGSTVLRRMEILHLLPSERGMRTVLEFLRYDPQPLSDDLFDPASARTLP